MRSKLKEARQKAGMTQQQMADYLSVDRSALSGELSKMQKEGVIAYEKNRFTVL